MVEDDMAINILHLSINDYFLLDFFFPLGYSPQSRIIGSKSTAGVITRRKLDIATLSGIGTSHFPETIRWLRMLGFEVS